jgi:hypothetical protein
MDNNLAPGAYKLQGKFNVGVFLSDIRSTLHEAQTEFIKVLQNGSLYKNQYRI